MYGGKGRKGYAVVHLSFIVQLSSAVQVSTTIITNGCTTEYLYSAKHKEILHSFFEHLNMTVIKKNNCLYYPLDSIYCKALYKGWGRDSEYSFEEG